jgi:hypothetical protein
MIDMKDRPSFLRNQQLSHRDYHNMWWRQRVGVEPPTWFIVLQSLIIFPMIIALGWLVMFL